MEIIFPEGCQFLKTRRVVLTKIIDKKQEIFCTRIWDWVCGSLNFWKSNFVA